MRLGVAAALAFTLLLAGDAGGALPGRNGAIAFVRSPAPGAGAVDLAAVGSAGGTVRLLEPADPGIERDPAVSRDGRRIAYTSYRGGNWDVYVRADDGSVTRVTADPAADAWASWSPDGSRLVFAGERRGRAELYVAGADGAAPTRITTTAVPGPPFGLIGVPDGDIGPAWSPDGRTIAFSRRTGTGSGIYLVAQDGSGERRLTTAPPSAVDGPPSWSPDGSAVAFARTTLTSSGFVSALWVAPLAGSAPREVPGTASSGDPAWSPDGSALAFVRGGDLVLVGRDGGAPRVLSRAAAESSRPAWHPDGRTVLFTRVRPLPARGLRLLVAGGARVLELPGGSFPRDRADPAWSPDGSRLAYVREGRLVVADADLRKRRTLTRAAVATAPAWSPDGSQLALGLGDDVYTIAADGSRLRRLTRAVGPEQDPAWSPDGRWIAYAAPARVRDDFELWRIRPDGSGRQRLTDNAFRDRAPAWSPDGARIAFVSGRTEGLFNDELWTMFADGRGERRVQAAATADRSEVWSDEHPDWSPDGRRLVYTSRGDLWTVHPDGTGATDVTPDGDSVDDVPAWQPLCTRSGSARANRLTGAGGADLLCGRAGDDAIGGGRGRDRLFGGDGDDRISARDGAFDVVGCGAGRDIVVADRIDLVGVDCERVSRS